MILFDKYIVNIPKSTMATIPNSNPLNGRKERNPLNPKILSKPMAHDGQAGAMRPTRMPDELAPIIPFT